MFIIDELNDKLIIFIFHPIINFALRETANYTYRL